MDVRARRGFTLIELLVVIGIIALVSAITVVTYQAVAQDAKLSSGKNSVAAALDTARSLAMKNNRIVLLAFRPVLEGKKQRMEAVFAQYAGSAIASVGGNGQVVDRFTLIADVPPRVLPEGIKVASPAYGNNALGDFVWYTPSHLPAITAFAGEAPGRLISIMYGPDGTTVTRNSHSDSVRTWIDFNGDGEQMIDGGPIIYAIPTSPPTISPIDFNETYFEHRLPSEEPYVDVAVFIAVFDDSECRELYDVGTWAFPNPPSNRQNDYTTYLNNNADPVYFNRYTGVVMK